MLVSVPGCLWSSSDLTTPPEPPGIAPAIGEATLFDVAWTAPIPVNTQDLAIVAPAGGGAAQIVALAIDGVIRRYDHQGRQITMFEVQNDAFALLAGPTGGAGTFGVLSKRFERGDHPFHPRAAEVFLGARRLDGQEVWTHARPAPTNTWFRALPVVRDGEARTLLQIGDDLALVDAAGTTRSTSPALSCPEWTAADLDGDGESEVLVTHPAREGAEVRELDDALGLAATPVWHTVHSGGVFAGALEVGGPVFVAAIGMATAPDANGHLPDRLQVYTGDGELVCTADLPWPVRHSGTQPILTLDTDGDGSRAWVVSGDDGRLYLYSAGCAESEVHATGRGTRVMRVLARPDGDLLVVGESRAVRVWQRVRGRASGVD